LLEINHLHAYAGMNDSMMIVKQLIIYVVEK